MEQVRKEESIFSTLVLGSTMKCRDLAGVYTSLMETSRTSLLVSTRRVRSTVTVNTVGRMATFTRVTGREVVF